MSTDKNVQAKVLQGLSDELNARNGRSRNMLISSLRYQSLQSRFNAHSEPEKLAEAAEVIIAKAKLLCHGSDVNTDFSHWRQYQKFDFCLPGFESISVTHAINVSDGTFPLFCYEPVIRVWQ